MNMTVGNFFLAWLTHLSDCAFEVESGACERVVGVDMDYITLHFGYHNGHRAVVCHGSKCHSSLYFACFSELVFWDFCNERLVSLAVALIGLHVDLEFIAGSHTFEV
jgi:hypothetical protein